MGFGTTLREVATQMRRSGASSKLQRQLEVAAFRNIATPTGFGAIKKACSS